MQQVQLAQISEPAVRPPDADVALLTAIGLGDREALARLYSLHQRRLFRYLYQLTQDSGLAEEILQDTLIAVWRGAGRFQGRSSVQTWLFGIARRRAYESLRRRRPDAVGDRLDTGIADREPGPEGQAVAHEDRRALLGAVGRLSPPQRETLTLVFVEGFSYREVAAILDVPEGTVKSRISNARAALRGDLGGNRSHEYKGEQR